MISQHSCRERPGNHSLNSRGSFGGGGTGSSAIRLSAAQFMIARAISS